MPATPTGHVHVQCKRARTKSGRKYMQCPACIRGESGDRTTSDREYIMYYPQITRVSQDFLASLTLPSIRLRLLAAPYLFSGKYTTNDFTIAALLLLHIHRNFPVQVPSKYIRKKQLPLETSSFCFLRFSFFWIFSSYTQSSYRYEIVEMGTSRKMAISERPGRLLTLPYLGCYLTQGAVCCGFLFIE